MSRYIDVDKAIDAVSTYKGQRCYEDRDMYIKRVLNELPSEDVEPVRHGRWIKHYECCDAFICSECGTPSIVVQKYCCVCGARMDGRSKGHE